LHYPEVIEDDDYFIVKDDVGDIKHQLNKELFNIPLRIFASQKITQKSFIIHCELYAKNIKTLIKKDLEIKITTGNKGCKQCGGCDDIESAEPARGRP
jgi:hypothetical protein